jgi:hypothetical protein
MDQARKHAISARICPQCGAAFVCGLAASDSLDGDGIADVHCWCFDLPPVMPVRADTACLCPACLTKAIQQATHKATPEEKP